IGKNVRLRTESSQRSCDTSLQFRIRTSSNFLTICFSIGETDGAFCKDIAEFHTSRSAGDNFCFNNSITLIFTASPIAAVSGCCLSRGNCRIPSRSSDGALLALKATLSPIACVFLSPQCQPGLFFFSVYGVPSSVCRGCNGTAGLYCGAGLAGLLNGLICFLGFFFSRPRLSRLPMAFSSCLKTNVFLFLQILSHRA